MEGFAYIAAFLCHRNDFTKHTKPLFFARLGPNTQPNDLDTCKHHWHCYSFPFVIIVKAVPVVSYNKGVPKFTSDLGRIKVRRLVFHNVELNTCEIILHSKYLDNQKSRFHFAFPVLHCIIFDDTPVPCLNFFLTTYISRHISYPLKIELNTYAISPSFSIDIILSVCIVLHP